MLGNYHAWRYLEEKPERAAFARALRDARLQDLDDGMQLLSFDPPIRFPNHPHERHSHMLVRSFFGALFERISNMKTAMLTGVPGSGTSWWVWYAMHRLLNQNPAPTIVWHNNRLVGDNCLLFKGGRAYEGPLAAFLNELQDPSTWCFTDCVQTVWEGARTVMVCSPEPYHEGIFKRWLKSQPHICLVMPIWTWPEIEALWAASYKDKVPLERTRHLFQVWYGGIPRHVLVQPSAYKDDTRHDAEQAERAVNVVFMRPERIHIMFAIAASPFRLSGPERNHLVFHQDVDTTTFKDVTTRFATPHMGRLFIRNVIYALQLDSLESVSRFVSKMAPGSSSMDQGLRSLVYEELQHGVLCAGLAPMQYRFLDVPVSSSTANRTGTADRELAMQAAVEQATAAAAQAAGTATGAPLYVALPQLEQHTFDAGDISSFRAAVQQYTAGCYLRPEGPPHPVMSAYVYPNTLVRFVTTREGEGALDEGLLERYLKCLPRRSKYFLDYLVPPGMFPTFRAVPLERRAQHKRVCKTYVRVVKLDVSPRPAAAPAVQHSQQREA